MQYRTGTINTAAGSPIITGNDTEWVAAGIQAGAILYVLDDPTPYVVSQVDGATQLRVNANLPANLSDYAYVIATGFTGARGYPLLSRGDVNAADILSEALRRIDADVQQVLGAGDSKILLGPGTYIAVSEGPHLDFHVNYVRVLRLP